MFINDLNHLESIDASASISGGFGFVKIDDIAVVVAKQSNNNYTKQNASSKVSSFGFKNSTKSIASNYNDSYQSNYIENRA